MPLPNYPAPGTTSKTDGVTIRVTGDDAVQQKLRDFGPAIKTRMLRVLQTLGYELAVDANQAAPVGKRMGRRRGGNLARSFRVEARPQWEKFGVVGVAVRSKAKYHYYQEFGVDRPGTQVLLYRTASGRRVPKGQGEGRRFREGTNRLNPGVSVRSYRRDIIIKGRHFLGDVVRARKNALFGEIDEAIVKYIDRLGSTSEAA